MKLLTTIFLILLTGILSAKESPLAWKRLSDLPDHEGMAGVFAGVVKDGETSHLLVAGGANFPDKKPWEGGVKKYYGQIFSLDLGKEKVLWQVEKLALDALMGYGMSVTDEERGVAYFLGGKVPSVDGVESFSDEVWEISWRDGQVQQKSLPPMPQACADGVSALVDGQIVVGAGDFLDGNEPVTLRKFFVLDPKNAAAGWRVIEFPAGARGRMHATCGVRGGDFYLFGGRDFASGDEEKDERVFGLDFLKDAWVLKVATGEWKRLADLPAGLSAAPSTALPVGVGHFFIFGGVGVKLMKKQMALRPETKGQGFAHPGFSRKILAYDANADRWSEVGELPLQIDGAGGDFNSGDMLRGGGEQSERRALARRELAIENTGRAGAQRSLAIFPPVTTPLVVAGGKFYLVSGEIKPGVRSPQVLVGEIVTRKAPFGWINWTVVSLYLAGMVYVGYWFMTREGATTTDDYFRGGQRIPFWVAGLSIFATMLSAITFMAIPGASYAGNWNGYIGQWPILVIIPLVIFFYLPFYRRLNVTTAYEYLEKRFNLACRVIASATFMLFHLGRVAIVLYLPALALSSVTNINIHVAIVVIGALCIIYTVMGGIEAVVWTDAIQALVLIGGALLCFGLVVSRVDGGFGAVFEAMGSQGKGITASWKISDISMEKASQSGFIIFIAFLFANLPSYTAGQDVVQRYVTTSSEKEAAKSLWMNIVMVLVGSAIFFALGTALYVFYQDKPGLLDPTLIAQDSILPFFIMQNLPVGVAGLIIAGIFAASQSTISSSLNSVGTAFVTDIYARILRPNSSDKNRLRVAQMVVVILGLTGIAVSAYLAHGKVDSVFLLFNTFIGFALGPLGGLFALGIFGKNVSGKAGLGALVFGVVLVLGVHFLNQTGHIDLMPLLYGFVGFMGTFIAGLVLALFLPASAEEVDGLTIFTIKK